MPAGSPAAPPRRGDAPPALLTRLPLLRGLAKLGVSLASLFGRRGAARPAERLLLLAALLAPMPIARVPAAFRTEALVPVIVALLAWMLRGPTLRLHVADLVSPASTRPG